MILDYLMTIIYSLEAGIQKKRLKNIMINKLKKFKNYLIIMLNITKLKMKLMIKY